MELADKNRSFLKKWFFWAWVGILVGFAFLTLAVDFQSDSVAGWFEAISRSPFAIPATILIYVASAFASAPQWMLHGGAVLAFGPVEGAIIAWCATMVSASVDFWLGRRLGSDKVRGYGGKITGNFIDTVRRYGFWAALLVRIVPTGPFVVVNLAAGVSGMRFLAFFIGTAIGVLPKIIVIAFFGEGINGALSGKGGLYITIVVAIAFIWMAGIYWIGNRLKQRQNRQDHQ